MDSRLGNLKEYVLDRRCQKEDIVMFLSQVASALHYLHVNHIVHGDLRAEYVNVLASNKVRSGQIPGGGGVLPRLGTRAQGQASMPVSSCVSI